MGPDHCTEFATERAAAAERCAVVRADRRPERRAEHRAEREAEQLPDERRRRRDGRVVDSEHRAHRRLA